MMVWLVATAGAADLPAANVSTTDAEDPYAWLEDIEGDKSLSWVKSRNAESEKALETGDYSKLHARLVKTYDSPDKLPYVERIGGQYYNFWQDDKHPRGLWRRATLDEYRKASPAWETVLDLDALDAQEKVEWTWHGATCLRPEQRLCLVSLSRGGADADVKREFDLADKKFVDGGFSVTEAKSEVSWISADRLWVMTDTGPGSMTTSGYPREARVWDRGTPFSSAPVLFSGEASDVSAGAYTDLTAGFVRHFAYRSPTFFTQQTYVSRDGLFTRIPVPDDAISGVVRQWLVVQPRTDWKVGDKTYVGGSALVIDFDAFMSGKRDFDVLFTPTDRVALDSVAVTETAIVVSTLDHVRSRVTVFHRVDGAWKGAPMPGLPENATVSVSPVDPEKGDDVWVTWSDYLTPPTLALGSVAVGAGAPEVLKRMPAQFDAKNLEVHQYEATSKDGTKIPYFQISKKGLKLDGRNPTLLDGYGGFEVSLQPSYTATVGEGWLEKGGVYVVANLRGGGEFGPNWHLQAIKQNRHLVYEDMAAVADDLVARKVTTPAHLGAIGGSNGGLLMGNMLVQYPDKFGAIVCQVPLLDMKRYTHLSAGASWIDEYGDPDDPDQWKFIQTFSPYQLEKADAKYPPILFETSTRDDRVGPVHARKMAAKMLDQHKDVLFWEDTEGGHAGATNSDERAKLWALSYVFLWSHLK